MYNTHLLHIGCMVFRHGFLCMPFWLCWNSLLQFVPMFVERVIIVISMSFIIQTSSVTSSAFKYILFRPGLVLVLQSKSFTVNLQDLNEDPLWWHRSMCFCCHSVGSNRRNPEKLFVRPGDHNFLPYTTPTCYDMFPQMLCHVWWESTLHSNDLMNHECIGSDIQLLLPSSTKWDVLFPRLWSMEFTQS